MHAPDILSDLFYILWLQAWGGGGRCTSLELFWDFYGARKCTFHKLLTATYCRYLHMSVVRSCPPLPERKKRPKPNEQFPPYGVFFGLGCFLLCAGENKNTISF